MSIMDRPLDCQFLFWSANQPNEVDGIPECRGKELVVVNR